MLCRFPGGVMPPAGTRLLNRETDVKHLPDQAALTTIWMFPSCMSRTGAEEKLARKSSDRQAGQRITAST